MEKKYVVGVDVGGHSVKVGVVSRDAEILATGSFDTRKYNDGEAELFMDHLCDLIFKLADTAGVKMEEIKGIGIGAPNSNHFSGCIEHAVNLPWAAKCIVPICDYVSKKTGLPTDTTNDANAAALGEMYYGSAKGMKDFIEITIGTGVGSGIIIDGKLVYGADGMAGELGHVTAVRDGRQCNCGHKGCLETYCSVNGMERTAREWLNDTDEPSSLRKLKPEAITTYDIFLAAREGDAMANRLFEYTGEILGRQLADYVPFSAPEAIICFGGLVQSGDLLMNPVRKAFDENILPMWKGKVKLLTSGLEASNAAILGASALGW